MCTFSSRPEPSTPSCCGRRTIHGPSTLGGALSYNPGVCQALAKKTWPGSAAPTGSRPRCAAGGPARVGFQAGNAPRFRRQAQAKVLLPRTLRGGALHQRVSILSQATRWPPLKERHSILFLRFLPSFRLLVCALPLSVLRAQYPDR